MEKELNELLSVADNPGRTVREWKNREGFKVIGSLPIYVPEEMIHAAGALPVKLWGGKTELERVNAHLQGFACSIVRAVLEYSLKNTYEVVDGFVFPSTCDHIQNASDIFGNLFPHRPKFDLVYPENSKSKAAEDYLEKLLTAFQKWLEKLTGNKTVDKNLIESIRVFNHYRELIGKLYRIQRENPRSVRGREVAALVKSSFFMPRELFNQKLEGLLPWLENRVVKEHPRARLILTGIMAEPEEILEIMDELGIAVVADDLALGQRIFRTRVDETLEPMKGMVRRHLSLGPCSTIFDPAKSRSALLLQLAEEAAADGVVFINMKFCEKEEFDYPVLKQELEQVGLPLLFLEVEQQMSSFGQVRTRLQAFTELLAQEESV